MTAADPALPGTGPVTEAAADIQVAAVTAPAGVRLASAGPAEAKATVTLVLVAAAGLMVSLSLSLLVPVLPRLAAELHTSATSTEWLLTATLLTGAVAVPVLGRLGDLYGKKRILVVSLVTFLAGSLICAFTSDIGVMIAGRAVAGLSVAAIPVGISLIGTVLPDRRAGNGIALISAMLGVGSALGLPLAGVIAEHADYHMLFWICVADTAITGAGTGIAYAAMPSLILRSAPRAELAAANGLNSLARTAGSSLASALGGTVLTSQAITLAGHAFPSLAAYRTLFAICAAAALAGAVIALVIPMASAPAADSAVTAQAGLHPAQVQLDHDREAGTVLSRAGLPGGLVVADRQRVELAAEVDERHLLAQADLLDPADQHQVVAAVDLGVGGAAQRDADVLEERQAVRVGLEARPVELGRAAGGEAHCQVGVAVLQHVDVPPGRLGERREALSGIGQAGEHQRRVHRHRAERTGREAPPAAVGVAGGYDRRPAGERRHSFAEGARRGFHRHTTDRNAPWTRAARTPARTGPRPASGHR